MPGHQYSPIAKISLKLSPRQTLVSFPQLMAYLADQHYKNSDFTVEKFQLIEYENCSFEQCKFSDLNLRGASFENCTFKRCDLSNLKVTGVPFRQVSFEDCKMLGIHFHASNPFLLEFSFNSCQMDYCSFYSLKIKKTKFIASKLTEVDFTQADLSGAEFQNSDLSGAAFDRTELLSTDFRNASNYTIDPELNRIKAAKFDLDGLPGLLGKYKIKIS